MIDFHAEISSALNSVLPTYHEWALTNKTETPCYSFQERNNAQTETGNTLGYSRISFTVKVWSTSIADLQRYSLEADAVLRPLGFTRVAAAELADSNKLMKQKILTYEALGLENY